MSFLPNLQVVPTTMVTPTVNSEVLTRGPLLARNVFWNLVGNLVPIAVALGCFPILKRVLGIDRLGVITLAWAIIGYFGFFDLGIGRALTKLVAEKVGTRQFVQIPVLFWSALLLMTALGLVGCLAIGLLTPWLVHSVIKLPPALKLETLRSFYLLGASIPLIIVTAGLRGLLEALQKFRLATAIRIPVGTFTYLGPVMALPFSKDLGVIVGVLVAGRLAAFFAHLFACFHVMPELRRRIQFRRQFFGSLLRFGGWMTISNIVSPLMVTLDRFLIGAMASVQAVAFYATPYELVTKLWVLPAALVGVLFPAFSTSSVQDRSRMVLLAERGLTYLFFVLLPITLILVAFAPEGLRLWLGADFARQSAPVLRWLAVAVFVNSLAHIPFAQIQGSGRPDLTAKIHLLELAFYLPAIYFLVRAWGIEGAAIAWFARVLGDSILLFWISRRLTAENTAGTMDLSKKLLISLPILAVASMPTSFGFKTLFVVLAVTGLGITGSLWLIRQEEWAMLQAWFRVSDAR